MTSSVQLLARVPPTKILAALLLIRSLYLCVTADFVEENAQCGELIWSQSFESPTIEDQIELQNGKAFPEVDTLTRSLPTHVAALCLHLYHASTSRTNARASVRSWHRCWVIDGTFR